MTGIVTDPSGAVIPAAIVIVTNEGTGLERHIYGSLASGQVGGPFAGSETFTNSMVNGTPLFAFPQPFLAGGWPASQTISGVNPRLRTPYYQQFNFTVERQLATVLLRVNYVGTRSAQLVYARDINEPPPSTIPFTNSRRPYPIYNSITWYDNGGNQQYDALQMSAAKSYGNNLSFNTGWTWAKDLTDDLNTGSSFSGQLIQDQFNRRIERANNGLTHTHRVYGNVIYALPAGHGQKFLGNSSRAVDAILGGWNMSWIIVTQSGGFFNPTFAGSDVSNTNTVGGRPDRIASGQIANPSISKWFDASAFVIPGCPSTNPVCSNPADVGRFGNSGLNILRGPAPSNFDFSLMKYFRFTESKRLQFRMVATNIFNHPNFSNPSANISSPGTVGTITSTYAEQLNENARNIHFSLRFEF